MPEETRLALDAALDDARQLLSADGRVLDPEATQAVIRSQVAAWHADPGGHAPEETQDLAITLGIAWGDAVCRGIGWEWAWLKSGTFEDLAVVAPDRSLANLPVLFVFRALQDRDHQTTLLLFNMLKAGTLAAQPGELHVVE